MAFLPFVIPPKPSGGLSFTAGPGRRIYVNKKPSKIAHIGIGYTLPTYIAMIIDPNDPVPPDGATIRFEADDGACQMAVLEAHDIKVNVTLITSTQVDWWKWEPSSIGIAVLRNVRVAPADDPKDRDPFDLLKKLA